MEIEKLSEANVNELTRLALALWPDGSFDEELYNFKQMLSAENETCFLARDQHFYIGFSQVSIRTDYVEGSTTSPVGYLEGIYVKPGHRSKGIATQLLQCAIGWAKQKGCKQFASDAELSNTESIAFHLRSGFQEENRIVCFIKEI
jgi:aminoglycoside 6'-N-acetyltransferase I